MARFELNEYPDQSTVCRKIFSGVRIPLDRTLYTVPSEHHTSDPLLSMDGRSKDDGRLII